MGPMQRNRRIERIKKIYKLLNDEETDIIAEYEAEYGESEYWDEQAEEEFNNLSTCIQELKGGTDRLIDDLINKVI